MIKYLLLALTLLVFVGLCLFFVRSERGRKLIRGLPGRDGRDGPAGLNGRDGKNGKDGKDGVSAPFTTEFIFFNEGGGGSGTSPTTYAAYGMSSSGGFLTNLQNIDDGAAYVMRPFDRDGTITNLILYFSGQTPSGTGEVTATLYVSNPLPTAVSTNLVPTSLSTKFEITTTNVLQTVSIPASIPVTVGQCFVLILTCPAPFAQFNVLTGVMSFA